MSEYYFVFLNFVGNFAHYGLTYSILGTKHPENMEAQSMVHAWPFFHRNANESTGRAVDVVRVCPTDLETGCSVNTLRARTGSNAMP